MSEPKLIQQERTHLKAFSQITDERAKGEAKAQSFFETQKSEIESEYKNRQQQLSTELKAQGERIESEIEALEAGFKAQKGTIESEIKTLEADFKSQKGHLESGFDTRKTRIRRKRNDKRQSAEDQFLSKEASIDKEKSMEVQRLKGRIEKLITFIDYSAIPIMVGYFP